MTPIAASTKLRKKGHPSFFGLHFSLALVPDRDPLRHIALPLDRYRNRDRYRVSFYFDYDCDPDFDFDGASQKSVNYFRGTMKDAKKSYSCWYWTNPKRANSS